MGISLRFGRWLAWGTAVTCLALGSVACSDDDDGGGGNPKCTEGCNKAAELCGWDATGTNDCLSECNAYTEEEIDAAAACMSEATTCDDVGPCRP